jgi:hypothetical protein
MQNKDNSKRCVNQGKTVYSTETKMLNLSTTSVNVEVKLKILGNVQYGIMGKKTLLCVHKKTKLYSYFNGDEF